MRRAFPRQDRAVNGSGPIRVLIADGDASVRDGLRLAIEHDARFEICAEAADAAGTVSAALRERPDVCVLDVQLPGGGLSATWEIGARLPHAKLVLLAASAEDGSLFASLRTGVEGYLLKTAGFANMPAALYGVWAGEGAVDPAFVARLVRTFRSREPRWRRPASAGSRPPESSPGPASAGPLDAHLTSREWEVLELLSRGLSTAEISRDLMISSSAVRVHIAAVVRKLGVPDRAAAVAVLRGPGLEEGALR